jgi:hypothetical protein
VKETNSIGMKLTLIPPGEFIMGSTPEQIAWAIEEGKKNKEEQYYFHCYVAQTLMWPCGNSGPGAPHSLDAFRPYWRLLCPVSRAPSKVTMVRLILIDPWRGMPHSHTGTANLERSIAPLVGQSQRHLPAS